jgi:tRNA G26 N,N-dimethylase Trm1
MSHLLSTLTPSQVEAMITQTANLASGWSMAAEHALTDAEHDRCRDLAVGYDAICKMLSAPSPIVEARIEGMREGFEIAETHAEATSFGAAFVTAQERLDAAIHAIREGGGR